MRRFAIAVGMVLIVGCGGGSKESQSSEPYSKQPYIKQISGWRERESLCDDIMSGCPDAGNLVNDLLQLMDQLPYFEPDIEAGAENGYFRSSCEALSVKTGDCRDMGAIAYRAVIDSCLVEKYELDVKLMIITTSDPDVSHIVVAIYQGEYLYLIDNFSIVLNFDESRAITSYDL